MNAWIERLDARFGLIGKVLLVLAAAALLTVVVAATAWLSFQQVVATQRALIDDAVPAVDAVQGVARLNTRVAALVEQLGRAASSAEVDRLQRTFGEQLAEIRGLLQRLDRQHFESDLSVSAAATLDAIAANLAHQVDDVRQRIELGDRERTLLAENRRAVLALVSLAESLAANASTSTIATVSGLYPLVDSGPPKERVFESLDRLVEVNIDRMERMAELQLVCFRLRTLLERAEREESREALAALQADFAANLEVLQRRLQDIPDPARKRSGIVEYEVLASAVEPDGLFALSQDRLERAGAFRRLRDDGAALGAQLTEQVGALVSAARVAIDAAGGESKRAVDRGMIGFLAVAAMLFFALIATLWVLFRHHLLGRLQGMEAAVRALGRGDFDVAIATPGNDPLGPLARALEQFRDNARERERLECELRRHQHELEDQVAARTAELQRSNSLLEHEVAEHAVARREAEEANSAKNMFLATLSHELRTPLSGVSGSVQLLHDTGLDPTQQEYVRMIGYANATLLEILEDMLSYSRLEAGKLDFEHLPFSLRDAIDNMLVLQGVSARAKGIALVRDIAPDVPDILVGDRRKLNQILLNVIGNAIKFTDEGSVTVSVRAVQPVARERATLAFTVSDTGIGIAPEHCAEVFKPFVQVEDASQRRHGGTGLGLAICQRLVELLGGRIGLDSVPGRGTQVRFELGFELADFLDDRPRDDADTSAPAQRPLDVLLVEDDEINRIVCARYLESLGHRPLVAEDGEAALELLHRRTDGLDAVLMDISLPGASGIEVARAIRGIDDGRWAGVPVVAMSAHVSGDAFEQFAAAGIAGFLGKPFDRAELARALAAATTGKGALVPAEEQRPAGGEGGELAGDFAPTGGDAPIDEDYLAGELASLGARTFAHLLDLFREDATAAFVEFEHSVAVGDRDALAKRAHRLAGAAGNLGFARVGAASKRLEVAARDPARDPADLELMIDALCGECDRACDALVKRLAVEEQASPRPPRSTTAE
ncbi:MAG: ATP-binding protein [Aromatoleum sp.]|jgi:two-component system sensor histidine kinase TorS|uniref:ATP-binding protein n=1 Tax=Aromatoleum sp. TaxID=2307007 RepID=UPI002895EB14|nr:ATP-binding protein [Aromatoleum sp.]MDT3672518.1 ATP-binding protein [Aromatoleum sp.]